MSAFFWPLKCSEGNLQHVGKGTAMSGIDDKLRSLVEEYRNRCLWFLRADYFPDTREEMLRTLDLVERYGDRAGYQRAQEIRAWLSQNSRQAS